jgi:uncharacterized membrane protein
METLKLISSYLFTLVALFVLDMLWIEYVLKKIYKKYLTSILKDNVNWVSAILFYLIFTLALFIFAVIPANSRLAVLQNGALIGFVVYSIYSLSNASFIKYWNWKIVVSNILWGTVLASITSFIAYCIVTTML